MENKIKEPQIKKFKLSDLHAAKYNPRVISDKSLEGLTSSIKRFGFVEPIIVNVRGGKYVIIGGHQRAVALEKLSKKDAICVAVDMSIKEEKLLNLTLNNPEIQGRFIDTIEEYITNLKSEISDDEAFLDLQINQLIGEIGDVEIENIESDVQHIITFEVTEKQRNIIKAALASCKGESRTERLISLINTFQKTKSNKPQRSQRNEN